MSSVLSLCTICLTDNTSLRSVKNNLLQSFYEKLSETKLNSEDGRPRALCCYCYQKLLRCYNFSQMAVKSEKILDHMYDRGLEVTHDYITKIQLDMKQRLTVAAMQYFTIERIATTAVSQVAIKEEPVPDEEEGMISEEDYSNVENDVEELLNIHVKQNIPDESKMTFCCNKCNKIFYIKSKFILHIKKSHSQLTGKQSSSNKKHTETTSIMEDKTISNHKKNLACHECEKQFYHKSGLVKHMRIHTGDKRFACNVCDKQFYCKGNLAAHMRIHTGEKPFECNLCDKQFDRKFSLVQHTRIHTGEKPFACNVCDKKFNQKSHLYVHMRIHTGEKPFTCNLCGKQFNRNSNLNTHTRIHHTGQKPFSCNVYDKQYSHKSSHVTTIENPLQVKEDEMISKLDKLLEVESSPDDSTKSDLFEEDYSKVENNVDELLNINFKQTIPDGKKITFHCNDCNKIFYMKSKLILHIKKSHSQLTGKQYSLNKKHTETTSIMEDKSIHNQTKNLVCHVCLKRFNLKRNLVKHMKIHTNEKAFTCNVCEKFFIHKSHLISHMRIHTGKKPFSCNVCDKQFPQNINLVMHMRIHTGEKPFACNVCDKSFTQKGQINIHMRIHTGDKPFACNVCNKQFNQKSALKTHMRMHTGEKPFACNVCKKTFSQKGHSDIHMRIHTGKKPFSCNVCEEKFDYKSHLDRHMRSKRHLLATYVRKNVMQNVI